MKLKNLLLSGLSLALVAVVAIGGTLAYLTDRDSEVNTFTVGDVAIDLTENFEQGAELIPGTKITKEVAIKNVGKNEAWVWYTYAAPTALINTGANASLNAIHFNIPGRYWDNYRENQNYWKDGQTKAEALENTWHWEKMDIDALEKDGVKYTVVSVLYNGTLDVGETTNIGLEQVYLDTHIDIAPNGDWYWVKDGGDAVKLDWNTNVNGAPMIFVSAYAIQADEFADVNAAYAAYNKQWGENGTEYADPNDVPVGFQVNNSEELAKAVANGETVIWLNPGTYNAPAAAKGKTLTIGGTKEAVLEIVPAGQGEANGQLDYNFDGSTVTFNGITIKTNSQLYAGYARMNGIYNRCVIQNTYNLGLNTVNEFNDCVINITNEYLRVNGAKSADFNNCTFNTDGRAILVFQDGSNHAQTVTVKDCTFNATAAATAYGGIHVAAVSIDGSQGGTYVVNLEGNNVVDSDMNGLWQIKNHANNVTVNE